MVGEVREYDELAGIYEKLDTVRISTSYEKRRTCDAIPHKNRGEQRKKQWQSIFWSVEIFLERARVF